MGIFERLGRLMKGFVGLFISGIEEKNPEALLEAARSDFSNKITEYNEALAKLAGIAERLKIQLKNKTEKTKQLESRIMANYKSGNTELAGSLARELQELKADLEHDSQEMKDTNEAYESNVRSVKITQKEFEEKIRRLERQLGQVKLKEAQAEAAAALGGIAFKTGDAGDTLKNAQDVLEKRYEKASGKMRVTQDLSSASDLGKGMELERKALEEQALAEFLANQGLQIQKPKAGEIPPVQKEIGPKKVTE
ncbi:MAG: PspA/IM30 family protein [Candidatus Aureabacteria bacterium]|nr:PspA/IM30 family protein [Candidatus Auribacterota bacterium]